jgi:acetyl esterase/lipase
MRCKPAMIRQLLALSACLLLTGCAVRLPGTSEPVLVLEDLVAGARASRLKSQTPAPKQRAISYTKDGRQRSADLYICSQGSHAGIVLVPGVAREGKDDRRLVALAKTLARAGFAVLVPDIRGLRAYKVRAGDVREVADAFTYLAARPELAPAGRAGVAGFSYAAGPVLVAALQAEIRDKVRFVMTVGGYYDLRQVITYFTTGYHSVPPADTFRRSRLSKIDISPNPYAKWVFTLSNLDLLERDTDRRILQQAAFEFLEGVETPAEVPVEQLAPDAQAFYRLLINEDPEQVPHLYEQLSPPILAQLEALNPADHELSSLEARAILLHGRSDNMIPYTESIALARALPADRVRLFLIDGLVHVDFAPRKHDMPQLIQFIQALLDERGGVAD